MQLVSPADNPEEREVWQLKDSDGLHGSLKGARWSNWKSHVTVLGLQGSNSLLHQVRPQFLEQLAKLQLSLGKALI